MNIVKDWTTRAGVRGVIVMTDMGHHCGYVGLPSEYPVIADDNLHEIKVHGGVTYNQLNDEWPVKTDSILMWYGFDCAHYGDIPSPDYKGYKSLRTGIFRDIEFCTNECENMAQQLVKVKSE